jgi:hypothetical protein
MTRPHYVPDELWLGKEIGAWPVRAFPSESMARDWAAEQPDAIGAKRARRIWRVEMPEDVTAYRVAPVPANTSMEVAR